MVFFVVFFGLNSSWGFRWSSGGLEFGVWVLCLNVFFIFDIDGIGVVVVEIKISRLKRLDVNM